MVLPLQFLMPRDVVVVWVLFESTPCRPEPLETTTTPPRHHGQVHSQNDPVSRGKRPDGPDRPGGGWGGVGLGRSRPM